MAQKCKCEKHKKDCKCEKCKSKTKDKNCKSQNLQLPDSEETFPDGTHYRIEVSGIETAEILTAVIDEAKKQGIPIHRAIATVAGSKYYSDGQLKELAQVAADNKVEVIICPDNLAKAVIDDPNKIFSGLNWQNSEEASAYYKEIVRCAKIGFLGFLVWRKGMLNALNKIRNHGIFGMPTDAIFKLSTFDNNANVADFKVAEALGANTINAANGLTLENLANIRCKLAITMDVHITFWQLFFEKNEKGRLELGVKPYDRIKDAPEIARICSPVYFKFEAGTPGIGVYDVPRPGWSFKDLSEHKRKDVRVAAQIVKVIKKKYPQLKLSDWGPKDLRVPEINKR